ncbi:hypothetical protein LMG23994_06863 [Cupriavidus pinatubonensis]|uniref:Uncharacterized protein n=3 Tax=Cupriavidus pinatubonensis TaxID=248026 RepID=A0ABN7ZQC7_9BURK|nr:hypothetical protein LMG23994_06863 [Cupriavidus pinatubonensis]
MPDVDVTLQTGARSYKEVAGYAGETAAPAKSDNPIPPEAPPANPNNPPILKASPRTLTCTVPITNPPFHALQQCIAPHFMARCTNYMYTVVNLIQLGFTMKSPEQRYLSQPVGQQLLRYYAARDAVRHATPLVPLKLRDIGRFFLALSGHAQRRHHC